MECIQFNEYGKTTILGVPYSNLNKEKIERYLKDCIPHNEPLIVGHDYNICIIDYHQTLPYVIFDDCFNYTSLKLTRETKNYYIFITNNEKRFKLKLFKRSSLWRLY